MEVRYESSGSSLRSYTGQQFTVRMGDVKRWNNVVDGKMAHAGMDTYSAVPFLPGAANIQVVFRQLLHATSTAIGGCHVGFWRARAQVCSRARGVR